MNNQDDLQITLPGGLSISARSWGEHSNPPLLALHGWLDNVNSFAPLAPYLEQFWCVAIDLPGHGHSQHLPAFMSYQIIDAVIICSAIADKLQWQQYSLLGHSLGAAIASIMAGTLTDRIQQLILLDGIGPLTNPAEESVTQLNDFFTARYKAINKTAKTHPTMQSAIQARFANGDLTWDDATLLAERGVKKVDKGYVWRHDPRLLLPGPLRLTEKQVSAFLSNIQAPTILIKASDSIAMLKNIIEHRAQLVKNIVIKTIAGGHHCHMDQPQKVAQALQEC